MSPPVRTRVHFKSDAFNTTVPKEDFINPTCYGDDVCRWLAGQLQAKGVKCEKESGQEDFGWYLLFQVGDVEHCLVVAYQAMQPPSSGYWIGEVERHRGFILSILGARTLGISESAVTAIHGVLSGSDQIHDVRWHFRKSKDGDSGASSPS